VNVVKPKQSASKPITGTLAYLFAARNIRTPHASQRYHLFDLISSTNKAGQCNPSIELLAERQGVSRDTVIRNNAYWRDLGILSWTKGRANQYHDESNTYQINLKALLALISNQSAECHQSTPANNPLSDTRGSAELHQKDSAKTVLSRKNEFAESQTEGLLSRKSGFAELHQKDTKNIDKNTTKNTNKENKQEEKQEFVFSGSPSGDGTHDNGSVANGRPPIEPAHFLNEWRGLMCPTKPHVANCVNMAMAILSSLNQRMDGAGCAPEVLIAADCVTQSDVQYLPENGWPTDPKLLFKTALGHLVRKNDVKTDHGNVRRMPYGQVEKAEGVNHG
jgi:hypothetical protein